MQGVQLVLVLRALGQDAGGALQQILEPDLGRLGQHVQLAMHLSMHPADAGAQSRHSLELLGVRVSPDLRS